MTDVDTGTAARFVGARVPRREDARLVTGRGNYVDDVVAPGALHAAFVRSPHAHARVLGVSTEAAAASEGVVAVLTLADFGGPKAGGAPPLAHDSVKYVGDPVAIVVAQSRALAEDGAELVEVDYDPLPAVIGIPAALSDEHLVEHDRGTNRLIAIDEHALDDVEAVLTSCAHVFEETISQHRYVASPMETRGIVARWDTANSELTVWISSQGAHVARDNLAAGVGIEARRVRVITDDVGGAFGQKIATGREEISVALAAKTLGRTVRWTEDRWENLVAASHSRQEQGRVRIGTDENGIIQAIVMEHIDDPGAYGRVNTGGMRYSFTGPYRVPNGKFTLQSVRTNTMSIGAYRGPWMFETVMREVMMDIVARGLGLDPVELRRRNVLKAEDLPYTTVRGFVFDNISPSETLEQAADIVDYDGFRRMQAEARKEGRYLGIGVSGYIEPSGFASGVLSTVSTTIRIDPDATVYVNTGASSQGHSVETTLAQVVADELGVGVDDVVITSGDTATQPYGFATGGSRTAVLAGGSTMTAAAELRTKILAIAAELLEASPDDLELAGGKVSVRGTPTVSETLGRIATIACTDMAKLPAGMAPGLEVSTRFYPGANVTMSNATHLCTCEVDVNTGVVTLLRFIVSEDCGVMINPNVVEGQIAGGVVQGIGGVLYEHLYYDETGNPLSTTFLDYLLPTTTEIPDIEHGHVVTPSERLGGFKGVGEGGAIGAPAAVINAVADALAPFGVKVLDQPLDPSRIRALLAEAGA